MPEGVRRSSATTKSRIQFTDRAPISIVSLHTVETSFGRQVELYKSEIVLFSRTSLTQFVPAAFPFAVPLMSDAPESLDTPKSSIVHALTATVCSSINEGQSFSKSIVVQPRRYTAHALTLRPSPVTKKLDSPTPVEVQIPRTKFQAGEWIPVYVTIPPPKRELVVEQGIRLRSIRAELVRVIKVKDQEASEPSSGFDFETDSEEVDVRGPPQATTSTATVANKTAKVVNGSAKGWTTKTIVTRSGAGCRFHAARSIRQRLILHQPLEPPNIEPSQMYSHPHRPNKDPDPELGFPFISQTTLLHCVTFRLVVYITFINMSHHTEHVEMIVIPLTIVPPPAPLPEADADLDSAYRKKHDQPPQRTIRGDDSENTPHYEEAGPSYAPPPFDERDAPPPFQEPSSSNVTRLPTFLEAEGEIYTSTQTENEKADHHHHSRELVIPGEGVQFGFAVADQFDGHMVEPEERGRRSTTPPPTMEMANRDPDVTGLASMDQPELAMEALGLALERHGEEASLGALPATLTTMTTLTEGEQPPPTLVMDDPSDPPPSIDSDYSDARGMAHQPPPPPPPQSLGVQSQSTPHDPTARTPVDRNAPPPYLVPDNHQDGARPPPYIEY